MKAPSCELRDVIELLGRCLPTIHSSSSLEISKQDQLWQELMKATEGELERTDQQGYASVFVQWIIGDCALTPPENFGRIDYCDAFISDEQKLFVSEPSVCNGLLRDDEFDGGPVIFEAQEQTEKTRFASCSHYQTCGTVGAIDFGTDDIEDF